MAARTTRNGFTLIELLVVIAIIGVLASLVMAAVMKTRTAQQLKTTEETVKKMEGVFARQRTAVFDTARNGQIPPVVLALAANDPDRAKSLWAYIKYRRAFPTTFAEAKSPILLTDPSSGSAVALPELAAPQVFRNLPAGAGNASAEIQAAACAYLFLTNRAERGEAMDMAEGAGSMVTDVDVTFNNALTKVKVFKDTFNNPITFVRYAKAAELNAAPYVKQGAPYLDPVDPLGRFTKTAQWNPGLSAAQNAQLIGFAFAATGMAGSTFVNEHWTGSFVSAGPDGKFNTGDDVIGYRVRQGGN